MKKKKKKKKIKIFELLEEIKMLQLNFIITSSYIIQKLSVSLKDSIFKRFFKEYNRLLVFFK